MVYITVAVLLAQCQFFERKPATGQSKPLARVENKYLYATDVEDLGLQYASPEDSTRLISEYINNWIRRQLMYTYAQKNLPPEKLDVDQLIEDYRQSLIIYTYEREYIRQNLDTAVSYEQAQAFYQTNYANFQLSENVYRILFLKIAADAPKQDSISYWLQSGDPFVRARLITYADNYAADAHLNDSIWLPQTIVDRRIDSLSKQYPLAPGTLYNYEAPPFHYYARVNERKIKDDTAPFGYVIGEVKRMIVNQRKLTIKKDFNDNIYKDAAKSNTFEIYE